jgi:hypothetical protein
VTAMPYARSLVSARHAVVSPERELPGKKTAAASVGGTDVIFFGRWRH